MPEQVFERAVRAYESRTRGSCELYRRALGVLPEGVSRGTLAFAPYPFYASEAKGAFITDVDGNRYLDLVNNYTSLAHGHAREPTTSAAIAELGQSSAIGTASPREAQYGEFLRDRIPAMQRLHFATTGSEAVGFAVRAARAFTGRSRIVKFEGAFHGSHNELYRDIAPMPPRSAGYSGRSEPSSAGLDLPPRSPRSTTM